MKKVQLVTLTLTAMLCAAGVSAQQKGMDMGGMNMGKPPAGGVAATHAASGIVKKLNVKAGVVTLAHGPVNSLSWPPMTMSFKVRDTRLLAKLQEGHKVDFEFVKEGDDYVLTSVK